MYLQIKSIYRLKKNEFRINKNKTIEIIVLTIIEDDLINP